MAEHVTVLLVCGSGASSGFMAANMRKAAKKRGLDASIMVGPHLKYLVDDLKEKYADRKDLTVFLMNPKYYSMLNGEMAIDDLMKHLEK